MSRKLDALVAERVLGRRLSDYDDLDCFSTSLDAIWPVAVRWTDDLGTVELRCSVTDGNPYTSAHVEQLGEDEDVEGNRTAHDIGKEYSGYNDNPATALCLALLRAHGVSESEIEEALKVNWQEAEALLIEWSREMGCCFTWECNSERGTLKLIKRGRVVTVEAENLQVCFDWVAPLLRADIANAALDRIAKELEP